MPADRSREGKKRRRKTTCLPNVFGESHATMGGSHEK
jgi:hypothetical protein